MYNCVLICCCFYILCYATKQWNPSSMYKLTWLCKTEGLLRKKSHGSKTWTHEEETTCYYRLRKILSVKRKDSTKSETQPFNKRLTRFLNRHHQKDECKQFMYFGNHIVWKESPQADNPKENLAGQHIINPLHAGQMWPMFLQVTLRDR